MNSIGLCAPTRSVATGLTPFGQPCTMKLIDGLVRGVAMPSQVGAIAGLVIGETSRACDGGPYRVVAIDPYLNTVEVEDSTGALLVDTIDHFVARRARS